MEESTTLDTYAIEFGGMEKKVHQILLGQTLLTEFSMGTDLNWIGLMFLKEVLMDMVICLWWCIVLLIYTIQQK